MTIRQATVADLDALLDMSRQFAAEAAYRTVIGYAPDHLRQVIPMFLELGAVFVADVDGALVGMLAGVIAPHVLSGERTAEELAWWVAPAHRGRSIGPRLLKAAEVWIAQQDVRLFKLAVPIGQPRLAAFLKRRGYVSLETVFVRRLS
jgi:GNAT superfamily N-acetyltransferase